MTVLDTTVDVPPDRRVVLQLPADLPTGPLRLVAVVDRAGEPADKTSAVPATDQEPWPVADTDLGDDWPADETLRRVNMYGDDGR